MERSREEMQAWVKQNLPACAAIAADFKAVLGDVRLVYASENGHQLGQRGPDGVRLSDTQISGALTEGLRGKGGR
jgi:hypothetical protein